MSQQDIILPEQSQILSHIRQKYFPQHKIYRLNYYKSLIQCAPQLGDSQSYQKCTGKVDEKDKIAHQNLQNKLDAFEAKYRKNLKNCKGSLKCYQNQLKSFNDNVTKFYGEFYDKVTTEDLTL